MKIVLITILLFFLPFSEGLLSQETRKGLNPPNIILIMADDLGYETIGANGGESYQTPEIDQMAASGMRFEHCYAQPLCTPSRIQIMTGIYNVRNYVRFGLLDQGQRTFGHLLKDVGYATCIVGKWQLGKDPNSPQKAGFDEHCLWQVGAGRVDSSGRDTRYLNPVLDVNGNLSSYPDRTYGPEIVSDYALEFIERAAGSAAPFFLYYPMILTHCPFSPTLGSSSWVTNDTSIMTYKGDLRYFGDMVSYMDKIVGKIRQKLENLGINDNTILIFTGDNGTDKPIQSKFKGQIVAGAKGASTDAGTRVPLIIQWPQMIAGGQVCHDLIDFTDFLPTLCEVGGVPGWESLNLDGHSFFSQIQGQTGNPREWVYSWYSRNGEVDKARVFARNKIYKLYDTNEFYQVANDNLELSPLKISSLDSEQRQIYDKLQLVIEHYQSRRGENLKVLIDL